jgi:pimeloyl-ACP methyl ester carboxylesterase
MMKWLKRVSLGALALGATMLATGATIEYQARARARALPIPGKLVDVGSGRRIQLDCRGSGSPTVVLESGLDTYGALSWAKVQDSIAQFTRVCAYSRAGIMWSDSRGAFDSRNTARDLHAALVAGGEGAPWVMVGHSIGAAYITTFTQLFDAEVLGLIFVDGSHPDQFARLREAVGKSLEPSSPVARFGAYLAWTGILRALPSAQDPASWPAVLKEANAFLPTSLPAAVDEMAAVPVSLARAGEMRSFGDRPLISLTAGQGPPPEQLRAMGLTADQGARVQHTFRALRDDQATWSRCGRNVVVEGASHYIQFDRPDVVIGAVREVVAAVR